MTEEGLSAKLIWTIVIVGFFCLLAVVWCFLSSCMGQELLGHMGNRLRQRREHDAQYQMLARREEGWRDLEPEHDALASPSAVHC